MCDFRKCLVLTIIGLSCVSLAEIGYICFVLIGSYQQLSTINLVITAFINFSILFFIAVLIIAVVQANKALLKTWIIYAIIELLRSSTTVYDSWFHPKNDKFERIFSSCDAVIQSILIFLALIVLKDIENQNCLKQVSTIGRSIEMYERRKCGNKSWSNQFCAWINENVYSCFYCVLK